MGNDWIMKRWYFRYSCTPAKERKLLVVRDIRNLDGGAFMSRAWPPTMLSGKPFGVQRAYLFLRMEESVSRKSRRTLQLCRSRTSQKSPLGFQMRGSTITSRRNFCYATGFVIYVAKINIYRSYVAPILSCICYTYLYILKNFYSRFISFL